MGGTEGCNAGLPKDPGFSSDRGGSHAACRPEEGHGLTCDLTPSSGCWGEKGLRGGGDRKEAPAGVWGAHGHWMGVGAEEGSGFFKVQLPSSDRVKSLQNG